MEKDVNLLLATYGKYFPEESMYQVRQIFENMDSNQVSTLSMLQFKDPLMALIISLLGGGLFFVLVSIQSRFKQIESQ